jgi:hypothetical protein
MEFALSQLDLCCARLSLKAQHLIIRVIHENASLPEQQWFGAQGPLQKNVTRLEEFLKLGGAHVKSCDKNLMFA